MTTPVWASYCFPPAAFFDPDVMRNPADGGWQNPWTIDHGFQTPGLDQALYPSLKTQMIEHHGIRRRDTVASAGGLAARGGAALPLPLLLAALPLATVLGSSTSSGSAEAEGAR